MLKMLITHGEHSASLGIRSTRSQIRSAHGRKKKKKGGGGGGSRKKFEKAR